MEGREVPFLLSLWRQGDGSTPGEENSRREEDQGEGGGKVRGVRGESGSSHTGDEGQRSRPPPLPSGPVSLFCRVASQPQLMWYVGLPTAVPEAVRPHTPRGPVSAKRPKLYEDVRA